MSYNKWSSIVPIFLAISLFSLLAIPIPTTAVPRTDSGTIYYANHQEILVGGFSSTKEVSFKVTTNATADVYLLTSEQNFNYPDSFTPTKAVENTKSASFKISPEIGTSYYLVIDNLDNSRSTDAVPKGDITYEAEYPDPMDIMQDDIENAFNICLFGTIAVVIIIIVVIIVIIYFVVIRKKPAPQQPVGTAVPAPYYQAPVQPQYPTAQPGAPYTAPPPPPSPYEPPPPPHPPSNYAPPPSPPTGGQYPPR